MSKVGARDTRRCCLSAALAASESSAAASGASDFPEKMRLNLVRTRESLLRMVVTAGFESSSSCWLWSVGVSMLCERCGGGSGGGVFDRSVEGLEGVCDEVCGAV